MIILNKTIEIIENILTGIINFIKKIKNILWGFINEKER